MHKAVIEVERPAGDAAQQQVAGVHNHVLDDIPEDSDVMHVLTRKPTVPEIVVTETFVYSIESDGGIKCLGATKDVMKK